MREIFSFIFDKLTDPLGLPVEWYWEWLILAVVNFAAYSIAYRTVGDLYKSDMIDGKISGSFFHWLIRLIVFIVIWSITYGVIWLVKFITAHWIAVLITIGGVLLSAIIVYLIIKGIKKNEKKQSAV